MCLKLIFHLNLNDPSKAMIWICPDFILSEKDRPTGGAIQVRANPINHGLCHLAGEEQLHRSLDY